MKSGMKQHTSSIKIHIDEKSAELDQSSALGYYSHTTHQVTSGSVHWQVIYQNIMEGFQCRENYCKYKKLVAEAAVLGKRTILNYLKALA